MKNVKNFVLFGLLLATSSAFAVKCDGNVASNFGRIKGYVPTEIAKLEKQLRALEDQLKESNRMKEEEIRRLTILLEKRNNRLALLDGKSFLHSESAKQFDLHNDVKGVNVKTEFELLQSDIVQNKMHLENNLQESSAKENFLQNTIK